MSIQIPLRSVVFILAGCLALAASAPGAWGEITQVDPEPTITINGCSDPNAEAVGSVEVENPGGALESFPEKCECRNGFEPAGYTERGEWDTECQPSYDWDDGCKVSPYLCHSGGSDPAGEGNPPKTKVPKEEDPDACEACEEAFHDCRKESR